MNQVSIGSDNDLSPIRRQAIIWTNAGLLSIGHLGTHFNEILIKTKNFSFTIMHLKILSAKWQPFCPGGNELSLPVTSGGRFKNTYELLNLRALKISKLHKNHIFQCMGKIFCVEFQRVPLKFHTKYLTHTLKDVDFIHIWKFKSSLI